MPSSKQFVSYEMTIMKHIAIIGAGITGLTLASKHKKAGHNVKVFESQNRTGGVVQSKRINGFLLDFGANTLNVRLKKTKKILEDHNAWNSCLDANKLANKRMIVRDGKIIDLPHSFLSFITSPFLSFKGKFRLLLEPFISRAKNSEQETVASFISRRLGKEALAYGANPFISGIYAAKPESLNLKQAFPKLWDIEKKYRSIILGMFKLSKKEDNPNLKKARLISYHQGMEELVRNLSISINDEIFLRHSVQKIFPDQGRWGITFKNESDEIINEVFDEVYSTIPSHKIPTIDWSGIKENEEILKLSSAPHYPLALVYLGFKKENIKHPLDGFGFLVPEVENLKILGTLFSSTLFPGRAPDGQILLTTFVGGERNPELANLPESSILSLVKNELTHLLKIKGDPIFVEIKKWKNAIPLPDQGMQERKKIAENLSIKNPGLFFRGGHLNGVSLPNCLDPQSF